MCQQTIAQSTHAARSALNRLKAACGIAHGPFTAADAERVVAGVLADQIDGYRLKRGKAARLKSFGASVRRMVRHKPSKVGLKTLLALAWQLDLAVCLGKSLVDLKQASCLNSLQSQRRWPAAKRVDVRILLIEVQVGYERFVRNDWSQAGAYLVALRAFSGMPLAVLATELKISPLVLLRRELDEYRHEGPRALRQVYAALTAIGQRMVG